VTQLKEFLKRKKACGESYFEFVYQQLLLLQKMTLAFTDQDLMQMMISEIDEKIQEPARAKEPDSPAELANFLLEFDLQLES